MIKYTKESTKDFTEDGYYLVRVENERGGELTVAEYIASLNNWYQVGIDYDVWQHDAGTIYELTVICRLDLEAIASRACDGSSDVPDGYRRGLRGFEKTEE